LQVVPNCENNSVKRFAQFLAKRVAGQSVFSDKFNQRARFVVDELKQGKCFISLIDLMQMAFNRPQVVQQAK
jgi:hypothetical protein